MRRPVPFARVVRLRKALGWLLCSLLLGSGGFATHVIAAGAPRAPHPASDLAAKYLSHPTVAVALDELLGDAPHAGLLTILAPADTPSWRHTWSSRVAPIANRPPTDARPATLVGIIVLLI